jgi:hypothetical protein
MPYPVHTRPSPCWWSVIPETCPPGEGMICVGLVPDAASAA